MKPNAQTPNSAPYSDGERWKMSMNTDGDAAEIGEHREHRETAEHGMGDEAALTDDGGIPRDLAAE